MSLNINKEVRAMEKRSVRELRKQYADVFGEGTNASNKPWLIKRIAWRMQSNIEGDISQRARDRAAEIANDADVRMTPPPEGSSAAAATATLRPARTGERTKTVKVDMPVDDRLPPPGTTLTRKYKGQMYQVTVLPVGFDFDGEVYKSLTAVAKAITGQHCNGFTFFKLGKSQR
jgi:hypothetical protein